MVRNCAESNEDEYLIDHDDFYSAIKNDGNEINCMLTDVYYKSAKETQNAISENKIQDYKIEKVTEATCYDKEKKRKNTDDYNENIIKRKSIVNLNLKKGNTGHTYTGQIFYTKPGR